MVKLDIREVHNCHDCDSLLYYRYDDKQPKLLKYCCASQGIDIAVVSTNDLWKNCPLPSSIEEYVEYGELKR